MSTRLVSAALAAAVLAPAPAGAFTLHILHINDFHSRIESINAFDSTCSAQDESAGKCFGGAARLYTAINGLRDGLKAKGENVVVLSAGDEFQGSLFFTTYAGKAEQRFMNETGIDAAVVGNHEFDLGPGPLADFIEGAKFPVLCGNALVKGDNRLAPLDKGPLVIDLGGTKVAIVGAITADTAEISSPGPTVGFTDPVTYLKAEVAELEAQGIEHIVALTHVGVPEDLRIAATVPGIDAIVGGHSHTLFSNGIAGAPYPYPLMADGPDGGKVPIVQAGSYSKYLGHLTLIFDDAGKVTAASGDTMLMDASVTPDARILAEIKQYAGPIEEVKSKVVAEVGGPIDGGHDTCRAQECAMGDLLAEAMLDRVKGQGVTIAIQNGGGLRASIADGKVSKGDVLAVLPFQNTLSTFTLSGAGIVAALENGVSQVEQGAGRFPQVAGLRFRWDPKVAAMQGRVRDVEVRAGGRWAPIDPDQLYGVVTNNFMRNGGDGYAVMRDQGSKAYDFGPDLADVLSDYLAARTGYVPGTDGRITRVD